MPAAERLAALRAAIGQLALEIEDVSVRFEHAPVTSYPGGRRPTSMLELHGSGETGFGEHVGWTDDAHRAFASSAARTARVATSVQEFADTLSGLPPYDRAALEAAAIDLALRQNDTSFFELAGVRPVPVRYVVSFAAVADPAAEAERVAPGDIELKIDADPAWSDDVYRALARPGRVAVLDFKLTGQPADCERAHGHLPLAWIEDPPQGIEDPPEWINDPPDRDSSRAAGWSGALVRRYSADAAVTSLGALESLVPQPAAVNVKPARIGSVLDAIDCLRHCVAAGITPYIGGMFEVGAGRRQLLALAAVACPDGPNDIAPLVHEGVRPRRLVVHDATAGFGAAMEPARDRQIAGTTA